MVTNKLNTLSCEWVTTDRVWIDNWNFWTLATHNYK
jgi:hypothetical protein